MKMQKSAGQQEALDKLESRNGKTRIYAVEELDGFYADRELDRTVHITFESEDTIVLDIYNTVKAAYAPVGEAIGTIEINLRTGESKHFKDSR